jgi:[acyl-carrier-protein] S-malonyltransferase
MSKTALMFAGQGAQVVGMGQDLAERFDTARRWFDLAKRVLGYDLARICFEGPETTLTRTEHAQPGIYLVGWVALQLLREQVPTFRFEAAAGLSLGEFTALAAAGAIRFEDGLRLVRLRGQLMQAACEAGLGGMAAVLGLDEPAVREVCAQTGVEIANLNCPGQIVISGPVDRLEVACRQARARGAKRVVRLSVAGAYHSSLMAPAQAKLAVELAAVPMATPTVPVIANVTARPHPADPQAIKQALAQQVTAPVRWEESMRYLLAQGFTRFVELGPGTVLSGFMRRIDQSACVLNVADVPSLEQTVAALVGRQGC